ASGFSESLLKHSCFCPAEQIAQHCYLTPCLWGGLPPHRLNTSAWRILKKPGPKPRHTCEVGVDAFTPGLPVRQLRAIDEGVVIRFLQSRMKCVTHRYSLGV